MPPPNRAELIQALEASYDCLIALLQDWRSIPAPIRSRILRCVNRLTPIVARLPPRRLPK